MYIIVFRVFNNYCFVYYHHVRNIRIIICRWNGIREYDTKSIFKFLLIFVFSFSSRPTWLNLYGEFIPSFVFRIEWGKSMSRAMVKVNANARYLIVNCVRVLCEGPLWWTLIYFFFESSDFCGWAALNSKDLAISDGTVGTTLPTAW